MNKFTKYIQSMKRETKIAISLTIGTSLFLGTVFGVGSYLGREEKTDPVVINPTDKEPIDKDEDDDLPVVIEVIDETVMSPVNNTNVQMARYFFDRTDSKDKQKKSIITLQNNTYKKSQGVDYAITSGVFDIVASTSGTVTSISENNLDYGTIIEILHPSGLKFIYGSVSNVVVKKGDKIKQGTKIASSGSSKYTADLKSSCHFEIKNEIKNLNPEKVIGHQAKEF